MQLITPHDLDQYLLDDVTLRRMNQISLPSDELLVCQEWLRNTPAKRYIFEWMYGDLFSEAETRQQVLDVGGGLTCFTRYLSVRHRYDLVDVLAHDGKSIVESLAREAGREFVFPVDWWDFEGEDYDLIVANDIFPNVDQRLEMFLERFLPRCRRLRISLTWYSAPRFYKTKRLDGDEIFFMLAWNGKQLESVLNKYAEKIVGCDLRHLTTLQPSLYANGRQVVVADFIGGLTS